jgi:periplasmic copper chaperone A
MRKLTLELLTAISLTLGAILALSHQVLASDVMVIGAFARASAVPTAKAGTVYMSLMNMGPKADRLLSVTSDVAASAELHESVMKDGVASMPHVDSLEIPAGATVELKPGGYHIMLMGLKVPLKKDEMVPLHLTFEQAGQVDVMVKIGDVAEEAHVHSETGN